MNRIAIEFTYMQNIQSGSNFNNPLLPVTKETDYPFSDVGIQIKPFKFVTQYIVWDHIKCLAEIKCKYLNKVHILIKSIMLTFQ